MKLNETEQRFVDLLMNCCRPKIREAIESGRTLESISIQLRDEYEERQYHNMQKGLNAGKNPAILLDAHNRSMAVIDIALLRLLNEIEPGNPDPCDLF